VPPWEVERGAASALWANRFIAYKNEDARIQQERAKTARAKRG
jgi:hypothetical protein